MKTAIIGCGNISTQYLERATESFPVLDIVRLADLDPARARAQAETFKVPAHGSVDDLLADDAVELVINLTIPAAHAEVAGKVIAAGKHVYGEKPLAVTADEGRSILDAAAAKGVRVGNAPDTFLGTGHQTARRLIDEGAIGRPVTCTAMMFTPGHERWHPDPEFYYQRGGGPMLDMGCYYLTALVNLLGPVARVCGESGVQINPRVIGSEKKKGQEIAVEVPDHTSASLRFASGVIGSLATSFTGYEATHDTKYPITVYGTEGTLKVGDPNGFDTVPQVFHKDRPDDGYADAEVTHTHPNGRSAGAADMAAAIAEGRPHRASGTLAQHVLEVMVGAEASSAEARYVTLDTAGMERPAMMPV